MKLPANLGPEMNSQTLEDGTVIKAYAGLRFIDGQSSAFFSLAYSRVPVVGLPSFGTAKTDGLEDWPEFDDIAALTTSTINGEPIDAEDTAWRLLGMEAGQGFDAEALCGHLRISLTEALELRRAIIAEIEAGETKAVGLPESEDNAAFFGRALLEAWIEAQKPRWQAEAQSAIDTHGLIVFGDLPTPAA